MKSTYKKITGLVGIAIFALSSCSNDLNLTPTNATTADAAYANAQGYKQVLAKVYGSYAVTGNEGPDAASGDVKGIDQGTSDFMRMFWSVQELSTEEAAIVWNDPGVQDFHVMNWSSGNVMLLGLYSRSLYQITVCNEFLRESTDEKLASRKITGTDADEIRYYRAEARFLRAFQYWVLMDLFGSPSFVTENDPIGKFTPPQIKRAELFGYIESELKAIEPLLKAPKQNEYGRVDQAGAWALLARMYLNSEVYLGAGKGKFNDAVTYAQKVIASSYSLNPAYKNLFLGDNDKNNPETILAIAYDGVNSQNWGGTTYLINAAVSGAMNPPEFGIPSGGWSGIRSTKNLPLLFPDYSGNTDKRAIFFGSNIEMNDLLVYTDGLAVGKFSNITSTNQTPPSPNGQYASTDFPLFRLAEIYLTYAEAVKRGATNGSEATALQYLNQLRSRAFGNASGNISSYTLDYILDERGRELYWEGFRRSDLVRFNKFTSDAYVWPWKGGVKDGKGVEAYRVLYPIPSSVLVSNPAMEQNTGY
ncbi:RagB/SusD family nutrient uptake outer membrane protein [Solitalea longa]|uniref:RagB/SusD family nutrient uptake outer membrane protein n=1 Tax=Solitalea longa TaxID=2079460 RepID=A0A2S5A9D2_9SPHI|nr:RagB/SusD family nutrient uptake outer membrane protein [Solitalea longa]POY39201.1 RagB/SusD family nutrient uptake outer membrane protein [Solitalea longa]